MLRIMGERREGGRGNGFGIVRFCFSVYFFRAFC